MEVHQDTDNPKERKIQNSCACEMHYMILLQQFFLLNHGLLKLASIWPTLSQPRKPVSGGPAALGRMGYPWGVSNRRGAAAQPGGRARDLLRMARGEPIPKGDIY